LIKSELIEQECLKRAKNKDGETQCCVRSMYASNNVVFSVCLI